MRSKLKLSEKVKETFRQHWIILWKPILFLLIVLMFIILLTQLVDNFWNRYLEYLAIIILLSVSVFVIKIVERRFRLWVVTNERVIYEWGVLSVNIKESSLDKINSTSYHKSLFGRILNYGDIIIETAAEKGDIKFEKISDPQKFADTLTEMSNLKENDIED